MRLWRHNYRVLWRILILVALLSLIGFSLVPIVLSFLVAKPGPPPLPTVPALSPPRGSLRTAYGLVTVRAPGPTEQPLVLVLKRDGKSRPFLRLNAPARKELVGWQASGPDLLLDVSLTALPSSPPGSVTWQESVVDLRDGKVLLNLPGAAHSQDYVLDGDLVVRRREPLPGGKNALRVTVVDLGRRLRLDLVCPPGTVGAAVRGGRIVYDLQGTAGVQQLSASLASEPWQPLTRLAVVYLPD